MKVIIPAAGRGTRMRPFTHSKPKPILPVAGKPMMNHILDEILALEPTDIYFIVGHLKEKLEEQVRKDYSGKANLHFVEQRHPRGTAQALWIAQDAYDDDLLVVFSDTLFDADLSVIKACKDDGIFWGKRVEDWQRFGIMRTDDEGYLKEMIEKPKEFVGDMASIGMFYFKNTKMLKEGLDEAVKLISQTDKEVYHVEAFKWMLERDAKLKVLEVEGWFDAGTTDETLNTNATLLGGESFIHPSAEVVNSEIGENCHIGKGVVIRNSKLDNCIIDDHSVIEDSELTRSIIGEHVHVRRHKGSVLLGDHSSVEP